MSVRTKDVLFRFDYQSFRKSMLRFDVNLPVPPPEAGLSYPTPRGVLLTPSGNAGLEIDVSRGILASRGFSPKETLDLFSKIVECVNSDLGLNLTDNAWFFEIASSCSVRIDSDPLKVLSRRFVLHQDLNALEETLGQKPQVNRVRIGPELIDPNRPDYYDIDIMLDLFRPKDSLLVEFIYRDPHFEQAKKVATGTEDIIANVVSTLTRGP